jgi:hypothetical protein
MEPDTSISIWFLIGISLLVNGVLILGAGLYQLVHPPPPAQQVVLYQLHANVWWGAVLLLIGVIYSVKFSPSRTRLES